MTYFMDDNDIHDLTEFSNLLEGGFDDVLGSFGSRKEAEVSSGTSRNCLSSPPATGAYPSTEPFKGELQFEIDVNVEHTGRDFMFSHQLNKVFVNIMKSIFVEVKCTPVKQDLYVRALPVFLGTEHFSEPVVRCSHHLREALPENKGYNGLLEHVIRSDHPQTIYDYNPNSKRYSVLVPLEEPQPGTSSTLISYMFACKNSCPSGMNRRATQIVFTLEDENQRVYGRKCMEVRICSCPKRDKTKEESDTKVQPRGKRPATETPEMSTRRQALDGTETPEMPTKRQALDGTVQLEIPLKMYNFMAATVYSALSMEILNEKREPTPNERRLLQKYEFTPVDVD